MNSLASWSNEKKGRKITEVKKTIWLYLLSIHLVIPCEVRTADSSQSKGTRALTKRARSPLLTAFKCCWYTHIDQVSLRTLVHNQKALKHHQQRYFSRQNGVVLNWVNRFESLPDHVLTRIKISQSLQTFWRLKCSEKTVTSWFIWASKEGSRHTKSPPTRFFLLLWWRILCE